MDVKLSKIPNKVALLRIVERKIETVKVRGKIEKTVEINPLDVLIELKGELGLNDYFVKAGKVYKKEQCSLYGDYEDVSAPGHIQKKMELLIAINTLCNYLNDND